MLPQNHDIFDEKQLPDQVERKEGGRAARGELCDRPNADRPKLSPERSLCCRGRFMRAIHL